MQDEELIAILRLQNIPHIGDVTAKKLISHCGNAAAVFQEKLRLLQRIDGIGSHMLQRLHDPAYLLTAEKEFKYISGKGISCLHYLDQAYPTYLKHCADGPILLFRRGNIKLAGCKIISVVGTRNITNYGMDFCDRFIEDLVPLQPIIVSGFALGIDIRIQKAALDHGLQTVGCLAHGLNQIYPKDHKRYMAAIEKNGGFLTECWTTSHPNRENFLRRNRIIAGMSEATVVIESAEKGGSLVTADMANGYNRDVFAVPGRVQDIYSRGCNNLIKQQKAHILTSAADMIYLLNWEIQTTPAAAIQRQLFVQLDPWEKTIHAYLQKEGRQLLDTIALECHMPIFKTSSVLLTMEMKGIIRPFPGKYFEAL